jgi:hypothetical protein
MGYTRAEVCRPRGPGGPSRRPGLYPAQRDQPWVLVGLVSLFALVLVAAVVLVLTGGPQPMQGFAARTVDRSVAPAAGTDMVDATSAPEMADSPDSGEPQTRSATNEDAGSGSPDPTPAPTAVAVLPPPQPAAPGAPAEAVASTRAPSLAVPPNQGADPPAAVAASPPLPAVPDPTPSRPAAPDPTPVPPPAPLRRSVTLAQGVYI